VDGQDADRLRLVPARGGHAGEAAAVLRPAVPAGRGRRHLLRAARRADRQVLGGADPGRIHLQRQGVQPVHPAPHSGQGTARRPARGGGQDRQGPGVPQGCRPGSGRPGLGQVPDRPRAAASGGKARCDPAAVPALVPYLPFPQGLHPGLRATGRARPDMHRIPQPYLDDAGQSGRDPGVPGRPSAALRVRGHAAGLSQLHSPGAGGHQRPGPGPHARPLRQVGQQGHLRAVRLPLQRR